MIGISFPSFIFSRKVLLVALVSPLIQFCACWLRKSIRKGSTTIPFYRHIPRFGHVQRDLISTFILFMRTAVHRLTQDLFSHLLWTVVSLPPFFFFLYLSYFCCAIFYFCTSIVYRTVFFILHSNFCLCFALGHYLAVFVLSLSWFGFLYFCCSIFFHSIAFVFFLFFFFFLMLIFLFPPFSHSLFFFSWLFFLFCFFFIFSFVCFWFIFFVSNCFSYCWFMLFLWFLLYCILSVFTSLIIFEFSFSFCL